MRVRKRKIIGTKGRPRLSVSKSLKNISAQIIDDISGKTLCAASTLKEKVGGNVAAAKVVGEKLAALAKTAGVTKVVFDRGKNKYHGRVAALAKAAREGGLEF